MSPLFVRIAMSCVAKKKLSWLVYVDLGPGDAAVSLVAALMS